jgi:hypothetical protein
MLLRADSLSALNIAQCGPPSTVLFNLPSHEEGMVRRGRQGKAREGKGRQGKGRWEGGGEFR